MGVLKPLHEGDAARPPPSMPIVERVHVRIS
jgi:hypothetical protein